MGKRRHHTGTQKFQGKSTGVAYAEQLASRKIQDAKPTTLQATVQFSQQDYSLIIRYWNKLSPTQRTLFVFFLVAFGSAAIYYSPQLLQELLKVLNGIHESTAVTPKRIAFAEIAVQSKTDNIPTPDAEKAEETAFDELLEAQLFPPEIVTELKKEIARKPHTKTAAKLCLLGSPHLRFFSRPVRGETQVLLNAGFTSSYSSGMFSNEHVFTHISIDKTLSSGHEIAPTLTHEIRHCGWFAAHYQAGSKKRHLAVPYYPDSSEKEKEFFNHYERGIQRIEALRSLLFKDALSSDEHQKLEAYRRVLTSETVPPTRYGFRLNPVKFNQFEKKFQIGRVYSGELLSEYMPEIVQKDALKFIASDAASQRIILESQIPEFVFIERLMALKTKISANYHQSKLASELDAYLQELLTKDMLETFFPELFAMGQATLEKAYDDVVNHLCTPS